MNERTHAVSLLVAALTLSTIASARPGFIKHPTGRTWNGSGFTYSGAGGRTVTVNHTTNSNGAPVRTITFEGPNGNVVGEKTCRGQFCHPGGPH
jgi:hypothetical protein